MMIFNSIISSQKNYFLLFLLFNTHNLFSQQIVNDTIDVKSPKTLIKQSILPVSLIGTGIIINNSQFEKNLQLDVQNLVGESFKSHIDDYTQFVPIAQLYIADIAGVKSKNNWFNQTKYLAMSIFISSGITYGLNHLIQKTGPDGSPLSFPSGHTTFAFTNATVLFNEFQQTSPVLAYSGYLFATTTGALRLANNEHWLSDVLVGAGIGMISANLIYYFEPLKNFNPFKNNENITLTPTIYNKNVGFYFAYKLN